MYFLIISILLFVTLLLLAVLIGFIFFAIDSFFELPFIPAKKSKVPTIIKLAQIKPGDTVIDLGSGDGRLLFAAAKLGARAIGYELNPYLVTFTKIKAKVLKYSSSDHVQSYERDSREVSSSDSSRQARTINNRGSITVHRSDLWKAKLRSADVIFVYGRQGTMPKFQDFIYKNAKKGTRVVVNTDLTKPFPTKKPVKVENEVYLYKM